MINKPFRIDRTPSRMPHYPYFVAFAESGRFAQGAVGAVDANVNSGACTTRAKIDRTPFFRSPIAPFSGKKAARGAQ
jgi:hypothetical protein